MSVADSNTFTRSALDGALIAQFLKDGNYTEEVAQAHAHMRLLHEELTAAGAPNEKLGEKLALIERRLNGEQVLGTPDAPAAGGLLGALTAFLDAFTERANAWRGQADKPPHREMHALPARPDSSSMIFRRASINEDEGFSAIQGSPEDWKRFVEDNFGLNGKRFHEREIAALPKEKQGEYLAYKADADFKYNISPSTDQIPLSPSQWLEAQTKETAAKQAAAQARLPSGVQGGTETSRADLGKFSRQASPGSSMPSPENFIA